MAYNYNSTNNGNNQLQQQRSISPGPLPQLRAPIRTTSNPPSPLTISAPAGGGFAFAGPGPSATTPSNLTSSSSASYTNGSYANLHPPQSAPYQGTARFHEAFAAAGGSTSRHASNSSVSSDKSFRFPTTAFDENTISPVGDRTFDTLQREFAAGTADVWGAAPDSRGPSPRFNGGSNGGSGSGGGGGGGYGGRIHAARGGRVFEESLGAYDGMSGEATVRRGSESGVTAALMDEVEAMPSSGFGRPASMAYEGPASNGAEGDSGFDFLLSPPPSGAKGDHGKPQAPTTPRSTSFANLNAQAMGDVTPRAKDRSRDRTFPAPLLLKTDRNRSFQPGPASPGHPPESRHPLSQPRRPSASSSTNVASSGVPPLESSPAPMAAFTSHVNSRPGPPNEIGGANGPTSRSALPYQRHRPQASSTSSFSHAPSQLSMNHSPHGSGGSSSITPSTSVSSSIVALPNPPPLISSASAPVLPSSGHGASSISDPPIAPQALLQHVLSLRSASASSLSSSQSQGALTRSTTAPLGSSLASSTTSMSGGANHQRIRSAGSAHSDGCANGLGTRESDSPTRSTASNSSASTSKLETVDLSHKRIAEISSEVIDELKGEVEKLALGYNLLKDLPSYFGQLGSRLRYLNVRVNILTAFPQVLCEMPSLEILDISRNKIKRLPANPGTLVNLKVFSIAKNRVKRLPTWFAALSHLKVLKLDHNPLEWPPKEVAAFPSSGPTGSGGSSKMEDAEEMQRWLPTLLRWIRDNSAKESARLLEKGPTEERRRRPSVMTSEDEERSFDSSLVSSTASNLPRTPAMTRTESGRLMVGSPISLGSASRPLVTPPSTSAGVPIAEVTERRTSTVVEGGAGDDSAVRHGRNASHSTTQTLRPNARPELRSKKSLPDLRQSHADILADRRTGSTMADEDTRSTAAVVAAAGAGAAIRRLKEDRPTGGMVHANSARAALPTQISLAAATASSGLSAPPAIPRSQSARPAPITADATPRFDLTDMTPVSSPLGLDVDTPRLRVMRAGTGVDPRSGEGFARNSGAYFRRLSMLPASTISKAVTTNLLEFADAIRGILFALSQIYSALRQFVVFASQDRLPGPIARLMSTADGSMSELINALDRFDSLSRRGSPSAEIVRNIFIACRDSVVTFYQLVQTLGPHLGALVASADVRYTRTLLLMLYGSTGEIANSWIAVAPMLAEMATIGEDPTLSTLMVDPPASVLPLQLGASSRLAVPGKLGLFRALSKTRRHAGSFSVEDVQMGAVLPAAPVPDLPTFPSDLHQYSSGSAPNGTLSTSSSASDLNAGGGGGGTIRARKTNRPMGGITLPTAMGYREMVNDAFDKPMTPGQTRDLLFNDGPPPMLPTENGLGSSTNSTLVTSSAASTHSAGSGSSGGSIALNSSVGPSAKPPTHQRGADSFSLPRSEGGRPVSTANADATFVDMAESTVTIARSIYGMLLDAFDASDPSSAPVDDEGARLARALGPRRVQELADLCRMGNETTTRLRAALARVRSPESRGPLKFTPADAKKLGDDAYAFVQTVIRFAKLVKAISVEHGFAPRIREGVGQLTIATREFAKTLSNSSFNLRDSRGQRAVRA